MSLLFAGLVALFNEGVQAHEASVEDGGRVEPTLKDEKRRKHGRVGPSVAVEPPSPGDRVRGAPPSAALRVVGGAMLGLIGDLDQLLASDRNYLLGNRIAAARVSVPPTLHMSSQPDRVASVLGSFELPHTRAPCNGACTRAGEAVELDSTPHGLHTTWAACTATPLRPGDGQSTA